MLLFLDTLFEGLKQKYQHLPQLLQLVSDRILLELLRLAVRFQPLPLHSVLTDKDRFRRGGRFLATATRLQKRAAQTLSSDKSEVIAIPTARTILFGTETAVGTGERKAIITQDKSFGSNAVEFAFG